MMGNSAFCDRRRWLQTAFRKKTEEEKKGIEIGTEVSAF